MQKGRKAILLMFAIIAVITAIIVTALGVAGISLEEPEDIAATKILHLKIWQLLPDPVADFIAIVLPLVVGIIIGYIVGDKL
ncbi:MAG: hypothetical protein GXO26_03385 [Crenarchaeota archaeon]|nr:hypothetical protein [Thermoproteota archaeon]